MAKIGRDRSWGRDGQNIGRAMADWQEEIRFSFPSAFSFFRLFFWPLSLQQRSGVGARVTRAECGAGVGGGLEKEKKNCTPAFAGSTAVAQLLDTTDDGREKTRSPLTQSREKEKDKEGKERGRESRKLLWSAHLHPVK